MKKTILTMLAIMSVTTLADYNIYLRGGVNSNSGIDFMPGLTDYMKENITDANGATAAYANQPIIFDTIRNNGKRKTSFSYNGSLELTKSFNNTELGFGVAYINNNTTKWNVDKNAYARAYAEEVKVEVMDNYKIQYPSATEDKLEEEGLKGYDESIGESNRNISDDFHADILLPKYNSIPIYATFKYNFKTESNFMPYIKADLGYSFNNSLTNKDIKMGYTDRVPDNNVNKIANTQAEEHLTEYLNVIDSSTIKINNGLYAGLALGFEYKNFLAEIKANYTKATVEYDGKVRYVEYNTPLGTKKEIPVKTKIDVSNAIIGVNLGYKFSL